MFESFMTRLSEDPALLQTLVVLGVGLGVMLFVYGLFGTVGQKDPVARRMAGAAGKGRVNRRDADILRFAQSDPTGLMKAIVPANEKERTLIQRQLAQAGFNNPHALRNYYLFRVVMGFLLPGIYIFMVYNARAGVVPLPDAVISNFSQLSQTKITAGIAALVWTGFYGPNYWLRARVEKRRRQIEEAFPNALDLIQISVESGLSFDSAMTRVANEIVTTAPVLSEEFLITQREIQAGRARDRALMDLAERCAVPEMFSFASVVMQSIQFGTSISDALTTYATEMRHAREMRAQEMANKLPVKMSAVLASLMLPALVLLVLGPVVIRYLRNVAGAG
ncbi:type II secretion system F family protein [Albidovulum sp.]|uniref:type II secretion system F family protein n=1 Tax=Albidovulum sp. TaxID=1872424 RepID=UPI001D5933A1|nr:type II secretion system F family protein [Paracoccaceae bacterium]MCB2132768.1 type II secretion system F family protein [Paracoccaceae bacterium]MCB2138705.1 type II secretion system F family protein [Paracoccaceae bacterium]MCB2158385.1 type II secretion system F family protein [Paracoccaceae bacterium]MCO5126084.1 type II secretion system F family protein [Paracoccaceae bacterium]